MEVEYAPIFHFEILIAGLKMSPTPLKFIVSVQCVRWRFQVSTSHLFKLRIGPKAVVTLSHEI